METVIKLIEKLLGLILAVVNTIKEESDKREVQEIRNDPIKKFMDTFNPKRL